MTKATHTPGPWFVDQQGAPTIRTASGQVVCGVPSNYDDALLISESPAMKEALRAAVACLRGFSGSDDFGPIDDEAVNAGLAILARIDGEG